MDRWQLRAAAAAMLETAGYTAEVHDREVVHGVGLNHAWTERQEGLLVNDVFVKLSYGNSKAGRWWLQIHASHYAVPWVCKGAGDKLAAHRLADAVKANLDAIRREQTEQDAKAKVEQDRRDAAQRGKNLGLTAFVDGYEGKTIGFRLAEYTVSVNDPARVDDEFLREWAALQARVNGMLAEFRGQFKAGR